MKLRDYLALCNIKGMSTKELSILVQALSEIEDLFTLELKELEALGMPLRLRSALKEVDWHAIDSILEWQSLSKNHHLITQQDESYPHLLKEISDPPPLLYGMGNIELLNSPSIAMVGSRQASKTGINNAFEFAYQLAKEGYTIVSGLAHGIDTFSHKGALEAKGATIAVMGTGINKVYPYKNKQLANAIAQFGLLISEFPLETAPKPYHFPRRNRIISGLCHGVIVIEASLKSGSLITARLALEQNRDIFALPSSLDCAQSQGGNQLIKEGAILVNSLQDILQVMPKTLQNSSKPLKKLDVSPKSLVEFVGYEVTPVQTIANACDLPPETVNWQLVELELQGLVKSLPGGYMRTNA